MRAIFVDQPGGVENLEMRETLPPKALTDQVVIECRYASVNWADLQKRQGIYPNPVHYPAILGCEVSGHICELGEGVSHLQIGQPVAALCNEGLVGGYAEKVAVDADLVLPLDPQISLALGAAAPLISLTAYHILFTAHDLQASDIVLIHAIGGAVGLALTQLAKAKGATVLGTVAGPNGGRKALSYGADLVIDNMSDDFVAAALVHLHGPKVDLVIDSLGADYLRRSFDVLRPFGRVINIGEAAGYPDFDIRKKLYENSSSLAAFEILQVRRLLDRWRTGCDYILQALVSGDLEIPIANIYPLANIQEAHRHLEQGNVAGKLLLDLKNS